MAGIPSLMTSNLLQVFGERDPAARRAAIAETYTDDVEFADPDELVTGHDAIDAKAQSILDGAPGFVFAASGPVYENHDMGYLAWQFGPEGHDPVVRGFDVGFVRDGRLAKIYTVLLT